MENKHGKQNVHEAQTNPTNMACNTSVMYAAVTALCIFYGFSLLSAGPQGEFQEAGPWRC